MNNKNHRYNLVAENPQSTVVAEYVPEVARASYYQSEAELERAFIKQLEAQAYEYVAITSEADLIANLRRQLEKLNGFAFSDAEWERFFTGEIANPNQGIEEKTATIQEDYIKNLTRDDGTVKNVYLLQKTSIHDNSLQVINQYATDEGARTNRYQRESFWAGSGLFEYVQLFVISNGTHTKYYSNTTRSEHIREASEGAGRERLSG